jgi:predicted outer membrane protein
MRLQNRTFRWDRARAVMAAASLIMLSAALASAQQPAAPRQPLRERQPIRENLRERVQQNAPQRVTANRPVDGANGNDRQIAECLAIGNEKEVALGTLAAAQTENPKVKQFAEQMVKEHSDLLAKLEQHGAPRMAFSLDRGTGAKVTTESERTGAATNADGNAQQTATRNASGNIDFNKVHREIAQKCIDSAQREWKEHRGAEADMAYLGSQCVAHQEMIHAQQVLRPYASPQMQQVLDQGIASAESHLNHVKQLIHEVGEKTAEREQDRSKSN